MGKIVSFMLVLLVLLSCSMQEKETTHKLGGLYNSLNSSQKQLKSNLDIMFSELEASSKFGISSTSEKLLVVNSYFKEYDEFISNISTQDSLKYEEEIDTLDKNTKLFIENIIYAFDKNIDNYVDSVINVLEFKIVDYSNFYNKKNYYAKKQLDIQIIRYNIVMAVFNSFSSSSLKFKEPSLLFQSIRDTISLNEKHINYVFFGINYMDYQVDVIVDTAFRNKKEIEMPIKVSGLQNSLKKIEFLPKEIGNYMIKGRIIFRLPDGVPREVPFKKSFLVINQN